MGKKVISKKGKRNRAIACGLSVFVCFLGVNRFVSSHQAVDKKIDMKANQTSKKTQKTPSKKAFLLDVPLVNQMDEPRLYNGCEITSLTMLLNYHGIQADKNTLANEIPKESIKVDNQNWGNPNNGFVGDITGNVGKGYFVYHKPIYQLAKKYATDKYQAVDITGKSFKTVISYLNKGTPVWVITTANHCPSKLIEKWDTEAGKVTVTMDEHSVLLTGYDSQYIYVNDPYGKKNQQVSKDEFIRAWEQLGSQAVVMVKK